jgi:hypothetical protein
MARFSSVILQKSLYEHLKNNVVLKSLITGIFDYVQEGQDLPYITMGEVSIRDWSAKNFSGEQHLLEFHIWTAHRGSKEVREISEKLHSVLENANISVGTDHHLLGLNFTFFENFYDEKNQIQHGIIRFSAKIMSL